MIGEKQTSMLWVMTVLLLSEGVTIIVVYAGWSVVRYLTGIGHRTELWASMIILFSLMLYGLKLKALLVYAIVEIFFALIVCVNTIAPMGNYVEPVQIVGLFTSVYLVVRGLDNLSKGVQARNKLDKSSTQESGPQVGT